MAIRKVEFFKCDWCRAENEIDPQAGTHPYACSITTSQNGTDNNKVEVCSACYGRFSRLRAECINLPVEA